jgi:hypothetical protein
MGKGFENEKTGRSRRKGRVWAQKNPPSTLGGDTTFYQKRPCGLGKLDVDCVDAFFALFGFVGHGVAFADFVHQAACVYENLFRGRGIDNKTKAFGLIEELDSSSVHSKKIEIMKNVCPERRGKGN